MPTELTCAQRCISLSLYVHLQPDEMINCIMIKAQASNNSQGGLHVDVHFYLKVVVGCMLLAGLDGRMDATQWRGRMRRTVQPFCCKWPLACM